MKEKKRHVTRKKMRLSLLLIAVLTMMFSSTVSASKTYYLDDIESSSDPVFLNSGDIISTGGLDMEGGGLKVRYELSASSDQIFPGTKGVYRGRPHEVGSYELNGEMISTWRVKEATSDVNYINVILIPANNDSANYVGYFHDWTLKSDDPCVVTIKNTVEPENCYANFENGSHRVYIDEGTSSVQRLEYEKDFDAYYGSTVIEIDRMIIHCLRPGNHTLTVCFKDGKCVVNFVKGNADNAYAAGSQPMNAVTTSQQNVTQNAAQSGIKQAPKTGEV